MYKYICLAVALAALLLLRVFLKKWSKNINDKEDKNTIKNIIKQPRVYKIGGIISCICIILTTTLCFIFVEELMETILATCIVFVPLLLGGIVMICYEKNWKIEIQQDDFIYTNLFSKRKTYNLNEVTVKYLKSCYRIYVNEKHIVGISYMQNNNMALADAIEKSKKKVNIKK